MIKKVCNGFLLITMLLMASSASAYQYVAPGWRPFLPPYANFPPGYPGWTGYQPVAPHFFYPRRPYVNSWYRPFSYQRPWGTVNGAMAPDGSFWINFRFGGNYRDLEYLMTLMQLSANMQMGNDHAPVMPDDFSSNRNTLWPL